MRRLLVIAALTASTAACASASAPSTEPAPTDIAVVPAASSTTPEVVEPSTEGAATDQIVRMISLPAPSGDPELDALGAEIAGLEEQLAALDAAAADFGGAP